jgi:hypothetical protein
VATATTNYSSTTDTTDLTITIASLASSTGRLAGRESTVVDNTSNKYIDVFVTGQITTGTSPTTAKGVEIWVYAPIKLASSAYTYPIATATALTASDAAATFEAEQKGVMVLGAALTNNATSNRAYGFNFSIASLFGGVMPLKWGVWISHDTGVNLNATAGNHWITYTGYKYDIA